MLRKIIKRIPLLRRTVRKPQGGPEQSPSIIHGPKGIEQVGHRQYVGGRWDEIGELQYSFLTSEGLTSDDVLCDIACGSLRGGVHFVKHLNAGNYLGIEKEQRLLEAGKSEVGEKLWSEKQPELVCSDSFEFARFSRTANWALAQSLFTHLPAGIIIDCLEKLRAWMGDGVFYATFFECDEPQENPEIPHDHGSWYYTREQMETFGRKAGWKCQYIGDWKHPRNQQMMRYSTS